MAKRDSTPKPSAPNPRPQGTPQRKSQQNNTGKPSPLKKGVGSGNRPSK